jgi:1-acyl-sn-glycerol-3-phosphate acyltransferase
MKRFMLVCMNVYFYVLFLLSSMLAIPVLTLYVAFLSFFVSHRTAMKRFRRAISWYGRVITSVPFPFIKLRYEDHSKNGPSEPYVFVCNHRASSDAFLMCVLPHEAVQVVNIWPFRIPVIGFYARWAGYLNINMMAPELFFENAMQLLRDGVSIIFFPEGTRSAGREMGHFHGAAFKLALQSRAPIVPLCISGNESIPPRGSLLLNPGTIRVRRLPAIPWIDYKDLNAFLLKNRVRELIGKELDLMENAI